jgi:hypothetical protein
MNDHTQQTLYCILNSENVSSVPFPQLVGYMVRLFPRIYVVPTKVVTFVIFLTVCDYSP